MEEDEAVLPQARARRRWPRVLGWSLALAAALLVAIVGGVDTGPGHRLIVDRIARLKIRTGLRIRIGRIDGSIWNHAVLRDVQLYDLRGRFFEAAEIRLDWHPLAWARNRLDIDRLAAPAVILARAPVLRKTPNQPLLPGFDLRIGSLAVDRLMLGAPVAGRPATVRLRARADIRDKRALIGVDAASDAGDRLALDLDAQPDGDRFRLAGGLAGPTGGVLDGLAGHRGALVARISGGGGWRRWDGRAEATLAGRPVAALALRARDGRYGLTGTLAPSPFLAGKAQRLTAPAIRVDGDARLADRQLAGTLRLATPALTLRAAGRIDLARSAFAGLAIDARLLRPPALFPNMTGRDVALHAVLDGPFRTTGFRYALTAPHIAFDATGFDAVRASGAGHWSARPIAVPIRLSAARVTGLGAEAGGILANLAIEGVLKVDAKTLTGAGLRLSSDKLNGKLGLRLDLVTGRYDVALSGGLQRYLIPGFGIVDVDSELGAVPTPDGLRTIVSGKGRAAVRRFDNAFLRSLAGGLPQLQTGLVRDPDGTLRLNGLVLTGPSIRITGNGLRRRDGSFQFAGAGTQKDYGPFTIALDGMIDHPKVNLVFARPVDALGLRQVRLDLDPIANGFAFRAAGGSTLGPFAANGTILTPPGGTATTISVARLDVSGTTARGALATAGAGFGGRLDVAGGGIGGTLGFAPAGPLQRIDPHLSFTGATLAAATPVTLRRGRLDGSILLDPAGATLDLAGSGVGLARGGIRLGRASFAMKTRGGSGTVTAAIAGTRGRSFDLQGRAELAPGRVTLTGGGTVDRKPITLDRPATLIAEGGGWRLAPARLGYDGGTASLAGLFTPGRTTLEAALDRLPLSLLDIASPGLGLGGTASGRVSFANGGDAAPTGRVDLTVRGLSRAGLVLSSQPIDVGLAAALTGNGAAMRAVAASGGRTVGRAQARIGPLPAGGPLSRRLGTAPLFAQLRYVGAAEALWRLIGVQTIDLSGPVAIGADVGGTLDHPAIRGTLRTDAGRLESAVTGTVVDNVRATGRFDGSRLALDTLAGTTANGGSVTGSGSFDFGLASGVAMDLSLQASDAQLINRDDIAATVTGALRFRSAGQGGQISGDVTLNRSRYQLGAAAVAQVPHLDVTDVNRRDGEEAPVARIVPWTLDLKARAPNRLMVRGLGLDSEWRANLTIKGAVDNPAIGGGATFIQGGYQFAGRRFEIDRGQIRFSGEAPPDPILDITAGANLQGVNASIHVAGTGLKPEIRFESVPALPEDELLSRLLFGTSIANLSAPEALQLATAVASLRSGGGGGFNLDPINAVRRIARLDRLRILPADITTGQKTAVAAGKYIGRRFYVEVITDGAGYSATSTEFRLTRWLSLLSTISTIGRQSANVRVSKDY